MKKNICVYFLLTIMFSMVACLTGCSDNLGKSTNASPSVIPSLMPSSVPILTPSYSDVTPSDNNSVSFTDIYNLKFSDLAGVEFWFGSGVGAWHTTVKIQPDGTFKGYYEDSNMGDNGADYPNGTRYECYFSGKFSPLKKTGEYEYSMKCKSLKSEGKVGEEKIIDGVKVITSEPYGFDNADDFFLYLPGKKISELSEEFLSWAHGSESHGVLISYGLYNVGGKQGFIGPK